MTELGKTLQDIVDKMDAQFKGAEVVPSAPMLRVDWEVIKDNLTDGGKELSELVAKMNRRFTSGNSVEIERNQVTSNEWIFIKTHIR